ncbi:MAG: hypothetical protein IJN21_09030 [Clostridia bacterium]|nr:hypothetical protein [Clostridia bacterium]
MKSHIEKLRNAIEFTRVYKAYAHDKFLREAACLDFQLEHILMPIDENDGIAGRYEHDFVGFTSQVGGFSAMSSCYTYYFDEYSFTNAMVSSEKELTASEKYALEAVAAFWREEHTARKLEIAFASRYGYVPNRSYHAPGVGNSGCRVAGTNLDFDKLIRMGFDGLEKEIDENARKNGANSFYAALKMWIESLRKACARYRDQAMDMAEKARDEKAALRFSNMASALQNIMHDAPKTFLEGVQLMWIYSVSSDLMNYGRMDDYLGALYARDVDEGRITEDEGVKIILYLYKHLKEINKVHDCRIIVGGVGRKNEKAADRLAVAIMEASRLFRETVPQLTLRYYKGMDEKVFRKAMEVNAEGTTFPIIYSDETNVPAVMKVYGVPLEEARQYVPFGCGEYVLHGMSVGTPNNGISALKALELALHNGRDAYHNVDCGVKTGEITEFDTYDKLYAAVLAQLKPVIEHFAVHKYLNYTVAGENAPYLHLSLLLDDCIARGKSVFEGGVRYLNASSEMFGVISCADSLTAIKKLVYEEKRFSLTKLAQMLDNDFEGYERERRMCINAPKYGNDDDYADETATKLFSDLADLTTEAGKKTGLNHYGIVSVNNSMSAEWGNFCAASACGRKKGSPMANGNGPSTGADKCGVTALLNSMAKFDNEKHVGVINNVRFSKELFASSIDKVSTVLRAFYENGGVQTNLCVIGKDDLEKAMKNPENYQDLIVRIGGFSARFVTLSPVVQREIIERTTYGA